MSYKEFCQTIIEELNKVLDESMVATFDRIKSRDGSSMDAFLCHETSNPNMQCGVEAKQLYKLYQKDKDIPRIVHSLCHRFFNDFQLHNNNEIIPKIIDWEWAKERIVVQLVNQQEDADILQKSPHNQFADMATMLKVVIKHNEGMQGSAIVTKDLCKHYPVSKEELFDIAIQNTERLSPAYIELFEDETNRLLFQQLNIQVPDMYVLTNETQTNGAITMFYPNLLKDFAKKKNVNGFYLIPSSKHEIIIYLAENNPAEHQEENEQLKQFICFINQHLSPNNILSNHLYYYDAQHDGVMII